MVKIELDQEKRRINLQQNVMVKEHEIGEELRNLFDSLNITAFDVMGTIGAGKTTFLERLSEDFASKIPILVINGDLATSIDADRIATHGATSFQINTGKGCHLHANLIKNALSKLPKNIEELTDGYLFIENVGNLICPSGWDVGAHERIVITSVTEGPYHVKKHPIIYKIASIAIFNKIELADIMEVDLEQLRQDATGLNKNIEIYFTSLKKKPYKGLEEIYRRIGLNT
jgi:hydrogenase nickel incorporation protein HypB